MSADRCACCGSGCEEWALANSVLGPVCIMCRLLILGQKVRRVARLCPEVPWRDVLRIVLPRPGVGMNGVQASDRWERASRSPIESLAAHVRAEWKREEAGELSEAKEGRALGRAMAAERSTLVEIDEWEEGWIEVLVGGEVLFEGIQWDTRAVLDLLEALGVPVRHIQYPDPMSAAA